jgi:CBS domain-containing protein
MNVAQLMTSPAETCRSTDTLNRAAQIMWEHDCGAVPVVDDDGRPIATVTDRDICMATYTQGRALPDIPVSLAMSQTIVTCHKDEALSKAESLMRTQQIRRLPVVDDEGRVVGILSLNDIATHGHLGTRGNRSGDELGPDAIAATLSAISAHTGPVHRPAG